MPFLNKVHINSEPAITNRYPFNIPFIKNGITIELKSNVTFFVGENGVGKSTVLEGIAEYCGFNLAGGNKNHRFSSADSAETLATSMRLSWSTKVANGFFLRAESYFNFATYIDELAKEDSRILNGYGGKSLHHQSHGESFFSLFINRFSKGLYILDEPEAALSPNRQYAFMVLMNELEKEGNAQFLIATHSPILLCYPGAEIFSIEEDSLKKVNYFDTQHYQFTKNFLNSPEAFVRYLKE